MRRFVFWSQMLRAMAWPVVLGLLAVGWTGCQNQATRVEYVARVGTAYLAEEDLDAALRTLPARQDSAEIRQQLIDQWVTNELLYQEAQRQKLRDERDVQRRLEESERSVLIDALVSRLYAQEQATVSQAQLRAYYDRYKERLRLREPFVRVRYLYTTDPDSARAARRTIQQAAFQVAADSLWPGVVRRFAHDVDGSLALSGNYLPESRLFTERPALRATLAQLRPGQTAPLITIDPQWHVLQLVDRVPAGTIPELPWIENEVQRLLTIDARKQMYERQVQRLRTEAQASNALDIR